MDITRERVSELLKHDFYKHLAIIGEGFEEFMKEEENSNLTDQYLDYVNDCKKNGKKYQKYPVFCFIGMAQMIIEMHENGEFNV